MTTALEPTTAAEVPALPDLPQTTPALPPELLFLADRQLFEHLWRVAVAYSKTKLVPVHFAGKPEDCFVACQLAIRLRVDPFMLMQGLFVVHGKPGMEAKLAIALANANGPFDGRIQYRYEGEGKQRRCTAYARERRTGIMHEATITWAMVEAEGWSRKEGSKWLTMPDQMFAYRSAVFLIRRVCPEVLMGLSTADELDDLPRHTLVAEVLDAPLPGTKSDRLAERLAPPKGNGSDPHAATAEQVQAEAAAGPSGTTPTEEEIAIAEYRNLIAVAKTPEDCDQILTHVIGNSALTGERRQLLSGQIAAKRASVAKKEGKR